MPSIRLLQETIGALTKTSTTVVSLAPSKVTVGGQQYATTTLNCNISLLGLGGLDAPIKTWSLYYVYVVASGGTPYLIASTLSTGPAGHSAYKFVGYFDTNNTPNINGAANTMQGSIGDIKAAHMNEAQFVEVNGPGWVLADGRNVAAVTGSGLWVSYSGNSNIPDLRGMVLRGKNNGRSDGNQDPGGERDLGQSQGHATAKNGLTASASPSSISGSAATSSGLTGGFAFTDDNSPGMAVRVREADGIFSAQDGFTNFINSNGVPTAATLAYRVNINANHGHSISGTAAAQAITIGAGDAETRMRNTAVNYFIKVN